MKIKNCKNDCPFCYHGAVHHVGVMGSFPSLLCTLSEGAVIIDPAEKPDHCRLPITVERSDE